MRRWSWKTGIVAAVVLYVLLGSLPVSEADAPDSYEAEALYELAQPSIFYVRVFRSDGSLKDVGSGFIVGRDGKALTAAHVVEGADSISCAFGEGEQAVAYDCAVLSSDKEGDTALLQVKGNLEDEAEFVPLKLRQNPVRHGERVAAIGYPLKNSPIITEGIVNSPNAEINGKKRILVSAPIVGGMSGGPVLDARGAAVGIISGSVRTMPGIHLVVSTSGVQDHVPQATAAKPAAAKPKLAFMSVFFRGGYLS